MYECFSKHDTPHDATLSHYPLTLSSHMHSNKLASDVQKDAQHPLYIPMGCDRMSDIGTAPGATQPGAQGWLQALVAACGQPAEEPTAMAGGGGVDWSMYAEPGMQQGVRVVVVDMW